MPVGGAGTAVTVSVGGFGHTVMFAEADAVCPVDDVAVAVHVAVPTSAWVVVIDTDPLGTPSVPLRDIEPVHV